MGGNTETKKTPRGGQKTLEKNDGEQVRQVASDFMERGKREDHGG